MNRVVKSKLFYAIPWLFVLLGCLMCFNDTIWVDEAFSVEMVKHSFIEIIKLDALDVHPPLYYLIYKIFAEPFLKCGGGTECLILIGKIVSLIPHLILVCIGFTSIKREYGTKVAFLFNAMITGMPCMLLYATEIRMYSWSLLFVTCAFLQALRTIKEDDTRSFILLTLFSTAAAYTHYFACVSAIIIYLELLAFFFFTKKRKKFIYTFFSGIGVVVMYIPWIWIFMSQLKEVQGSYWIEPVSLKEIIKQIVFMFRKGPVTPFILMFGALGFLYVVITFIKGRMAPFFGVGVWAGTIIAGNVLSLLIRPIFVSRYQIASAGCLWLALAIALSEIDNKKLKKWATLVLVSSCLFVNLSYVKSDYETNKNTQITVAALDQYLQEDTVIISDYGHIQRVVAVKYPENENVVFEQPLTELTKSVYSDCNLTKCDRNIVDKYKGKNILVLEQNKELHELLNQRGIETLYLGQYKISEYTFDLYITS